VGSDGGAALKRTCFGRGPFGLRVTPDDILNCCSFLRGAAQMLLKGITRRDPAPWAPWRIVGRPAAAFRRRP